MKIFLLMLLVVIPIAYGLDNCKNVMVASEIPCEIISSTDYPNPCNTYIIKFYNSTPTLIGEHTLDDYSALSRCNASFNFSQSDTYLWNISNSGDSGSFYVEVDETLNLAIVLGLGIFGFMFFIIGIWIFVTRQKND